MPQRQIKITAALSQVSHNVVVPVAHTAGPAMGQRNLRAVLLAWLAWLAWHTLLATKRQPRKRLIMRQSFALVNNLLPSQALRLQITVKIHCPD